MAAGSANNVVPRTFAVIALVLLLLGDPLAAAEVRVEIGGLRNAEGKIRVALFRTPGDFAKKEGVFLEEVVLATFPDAVLLFTDVPPGTYGLAAFHDENADGKFARGLLGIPREGYGFGNDAPVFFEAPAFEKAAVVVPTTGTKTTLTMRYWLERAD